MHPRQIRNFEPMKVVARGEVFVQKPGAYPRNRWESLCVRCEENRKNEQMNQRERIRTNARKERKKSDSDV